MQLVSQHYPSVKQSGHVFLDDGKTVRVAVEDRYDFAMVDMVVLADSEQQMYWLCHW